VRKALCICKGGNTRGVTLARLLRNRGFEAMPCGAKASAWSIATIDMLMAWADVVYPQKEAIDVLASREGGIELLQAYGSKMDMRFDVGVDDWNMPMADELVMILRHKIALAGL
jgi:hypothetical protein